MPVRKMRWTVGYEGKNYGPGDAVDVPEGLARSLDLSAGIPANEDKEAGADAGVDADKAPAEANSDPAADSGDKHAPRRRSRKSETASEE